jgi:tetratricopeptide (TPR) repeat protein
VRRALVVVMLLSAFGAQAAPDRATLRQAGQRYKEGKQAYDLGDYLKAIQAFEDAFRLSEDPILLFNVAQSYRKQFGVDSDRARLVKARDLYRTFLREVSDAGLHGQAEGLLAEVEKLLAETEKAATPAPVPPLPTAVPPPAPPPAAPRVDAEATAVSTQATVAPTPWYKKTWVWIAAGVVAAGAGAGVVLATRGGGGAADNCPGCPEAPVPTGQ